MKIAVISDTHDRLPTFRRALAEFRRIGVGAVLHAGDYIAPFAARLLVGPDAPPPDRAPLHCIYGNNDGERAGLKQILPQIVDGPLRVNLGGRAIVMHHWIDWLTPHDIAGADIVITGHTHEIVNETRPAPTPGSAPGSGPETPARPVLFLNPGECCGWLTNRCTAALLDTDTITAEIIDIPE